MKLEELETKVKMLFETVTKLEARLTRLEDIEAIKKLQRAYGYYLEHWEEENLIGLWSHRPDITLEINAGGQYKGWEGIKRAFNFSGHYTAFGGVKQAPPEYLHILIPTGVLMVAYIKWSGKMTRLQVAAQILAGMCAGDWKFEIPEGQTWDDVAIARAIDLADKLYEYEGSK